MTTDNITDLVDPLIGTLGLGFTFPGAALPYGMVQLSPDTEGLFAYSGYGYGDRFIRGFSHVHLESIGMQAGGNVPLMPVDGPVVTADPLACQSRFDHAHEAAAPGYYRVFLDDHGVDVELTAGLRTGLHRYRFGGAQGSVLLDVGRHIPGGMPFPMPPTDSIALQAVPGACSAIVEIRPAERLVVGTANPTREQPHGYAVHFAARFSRPFAAFGSWDERGQAPSAGASQAQGRGAGAYVSFDTAEDGEVLVKVGISFVSQEGALANLDDELPGDDFDFDAQVARARAAWNAALATVRVEGGTDAQRRAFTTALYRVQHHPNVFSDADGSYVGHDGEVHRIGADGDPMPDGSIYYANFSLWDTYRGPFQLQSLIAPDRVRDMVRSLHAIAHWGGRLPRWSLMSTYPDWMPGEPARQIVAEAHARGLVPEELAVPLFEAALALAPLDAPDEYARLGYVPYDVDPGGASTTLEQAIGDFALGLMARRIGRTDEAEVLLARAANWANVIDPASGFARPRLRDGSWLWERHDPGVPEGFVEGTGWQYTWLVPHDVAGLFAHIGHAEGEQRQGLALVRERLDRFFTNVLTRVTPSLPGSLREQVRLGVPFWGNQYDPSNEHDLQAPFLYDWAGQPWKTQAVVRELQGIFTPTPDGLPGNDDLGTMSTWFVFSALGLHPTVPGAPLYTIGSPLFERAVIALGDGSELTIEAPGASFRRRYIGAARLGAAPLERPWITEAELRAAGVLRFSMRETPEPSWGAAPEAAPPSQRTSPPSAFG